MAFKFVVALAFVAAASAGYVPQQQEIYNSAPVHQTIEAQPILAKAAEEYDHHPQYHVAYNVQDSISGDIKSQSENRDGDVVNGEYSLIDADAYKRTVQYTADAEHGFNAVVSRVPIHADPAPASIKSTPVVLKNVGYASPNYEHYKSAPVAYSSPALIKTSVPVAYSSAPVTYSSPTYAAPNYYKPVVYSSPKSAAPVAYTSSPVTYASPAYAAQSIVKSVVPVTYAAPESYSAHATYAAPAAFTAHSAPAVKTVSPVSYASFSNQKSAPIAYSVQNTHSSPEYNQEHHH